MNPGRIVWLILVPVVSMAQPFEVTYSFSDVSSSSGITDPTPAPQAQCVVFGSFTAQGLSANSSASGRFSFSGWPLGAQDGENDASLFTGALSPFSYYEFSVGVKPGYTLNLQELGFSMRRSSTGPRNYCVRSNVDAFNDNLPASVVTSTRLSVLPVNVFFWNDDNASTSSDQHGNLVTPGIGFSAISGTVHFRIYAWNAEGSGGTFSIDNFRIRGEVMDSTLNLDKQDASESCTLFFYDSLVNAPCGTEVVKLFDLQGSLVCVISGGETLTHAGPLRGLYILCFETRRGNFRKKILIHD